MTDREKLIELLEAIPHAQRLYPDLFVDYLIDHNVTMIERCEDKGITIGNVYDNANMLMNVQTALKHIGVYLNMAQTAAVCKELIANGVIALPCKIGDEFWTEWVGIRKVRCSMITQKANGLWIGRFTVENSGGAGVNVSLDEIGKTLFKTKEEAEAHFNNRAED